MMNNDQILRIALDALNRIARDLDNEAQAIAIEALARIKREHLAQNALRRAQSRYRPITPVDDLLALGKDFAA